MIKNILHALKDLFHWKVLLRNYFQIVPQQLGIYGSWRRAHRDI